ncbi:hypothetical protein SKAU_G00018180 [Synaphobranchus kaupii]|uniref:Uncharacterized protein n=1 Tax=Synaphobranchus kaupii TaxID=118154 RepID=A0A9Q1GCJ9_SYNKA|nr:hypothetical protein SKAU_G00018180 [Synaphobranchus kaupii]
MAFYGACVQQPVTLFTTFAQGHKHSKNRMTANPAAGPFDAAQCSTSSSLRLPRISQRLPAPWRRSEVGPGASLDCDAELRDATNRWRARVSLAKQLVTNQRQNDN